MNGRGEAVGAWLSTSNDPERAILWRDGAVVDLTAAAGDPEWALVLATGVNDRGQIVGVGQRSGRFRPFLLTPR